MWCFMAAMQPEWYKWEYHLILDVIMIIFAFDIMADII